jgi:hypothetical protein
MARTSLFDNFARAVRIACFGEQERISTTEAIERVAEIEERAARHLGARREFLADAGCVAAIGMLASLTNPRKRVYAAASPNVGIVGAGLAGPACTDTLRLAGIKATSTRYRPLLEDGASPSAGSFGTNNRARGRVYRPVTQDHSQNCSTPRPYAAQLVQDSW